MALTKIKLNTMVTGSLPDANIPDDITVNTASAVPASGLTGNTLASGVTASSLQSVGTLSSLTTSGSTGSNYIGSFTNTSATGWGLFVKGGADNADYTLRVQDKDAGDLLSVKAGGRIGVGTNDPASLIHAKVTTNTSETIRIQNDDSLTTVGVSSDGYSFHTYQHSLYWASWDGSTWSTKGRMDSSGNLGVGTTDFNNMSSSSYAGLKVGGATLQDSGGGNGSATFLCNNSYVGGSNNLYLDGGGASSAILMTSGDIDFLTFDGGGGSADAQWSYTPRMKIAQNGNVAIGKTSDASEKLEVYDGDILVSSGRGVRANGGNEMIRFHSSDGVKINSGGAQVLTVNTMGAVDQKGMTTHVRTGADYGGNGSGGTDFTLGRFWHDVVNWGDGGVIVEIFNFYYGETQQGYAKFFCTWGYSNSTRVTEISSTGSINDPTWGSAVHVSGNIYRRDLSFNVPQYNIARVRLTTAFNVTTNVNNTSNNYVYFYN